MNKRYIIERMGHNETPHEEATECKDLRNETWAGRLMNGEAYKRYVEKNGHHFTDKLGAWASKQLVNADGTGHCWSVDQAAMAMDPLTNGWTRGDAAYYLNWLYSDLMGAHPMVTEAMVIGVARHGMRDPDGYDGMVFDRWISDVINKEMEVDWS
jgi:hypothetical protein